jgi:hypothetical protein
MRLKLSGTPLSVNQTDPLPPYQQIVDNIYIL